MKISTEIASAAKIIGEEKAIEYCAKAGFDVYRDDVDGMQCADRRDFMETVL